MNENTISQIQEALAPVAAKIGEGAEYGWEMLVWGKFAEGLVSVILGTFAMVVLSFIALEESNGHSIIVSFIPVALIALLSVMTYHGLVAVIAPEYATLKMLLGSVSGG